MLGGAKIHPNNTHVFYSKISSFSDRPALKMPNNMILTKENNPKNTNTQDIQAICLIGKAMINNQCQATSPVTKVKFTVAVI